MAILNHPDYLKIMSWNANSILNKKEEFLDALTTHELGVALISETFLKPNKVFKVRNYSVYRNDRVSLGGGTAILIKRDLQHHEVVLPKLSSLEANAVVTPGKVT
jgi:exonuclease III